MSKEGWLFLDFSKLRINNVINMSFYKDVSEKVKIYSEDPLLGVVEDFLSEEECSSIIESARKDLEPSLTHYGTKDSSRTSSSAHLKNDPELKKLIAKKSKDFFSFEPNQLESLQVVHYENGEQFDIHHDSVSYGGEQFASGKETFTPIPRVATILIYLNTVNNMQTPQEISEGLTVFTNTGHAVRPKRGRAVIFYNFSNEGTVDFRMLHTALPVHSGEKWALNAWMVDLDLDIHDIDAEFVQKEFAKIKQPDKLEIIT